MQGWEAKPPWTHLHPSSCIYGSKKTPEEGGKKNWKTRKYSVKQSFLVILHAWDMNNGGINEHAKGEVLWGLTPRPRTAGY